MIIQIFGILIMACIGIMFGKYWFKKLEDVEKAAYDRGCKDIITTIASGALKEQEGIGKRIWKVVNNPLSCFRDGDQIVLSHQGNTENLRYYVTKKEAKELWIQLLAALIESGEMISPYTEEEKQAMINAVIKVKNEI